METQKTVKCDFKYACCSLRESMSSNYVLLILTLQEEFKFLNLRHCETPGVYQSTFYRVSVSPLSQVLPL